jgi:replicative DNA helicase
MDLTNLNRDNKKRRSNRIDHSTLIYGKVPPQAKDLEEVVLGAMMLEPDKVMEIRQIIKPEDFYVDAHQRICKAIFAVDEKGLVDILLTVEKLREWEELDLVGGPYYVTKLTNSVTSSANIERHCRIIKQFSIARKLINNSGEVISMAYDGADVFEILEYAEQNIFSINSEIEEMQVVAKEVVAVNVARKFDERMMLAEHPELADKYVKSEIKNFDEYIGHFKPGGIYVVAARPGMGKTDFGVEVMYRVAKKHNVGFFSVEMTEEEIAERFISRAHELDNEVFTTRKPEWITADDKNRFMFGLQEFVNLKLWIDTNTRIDRIIAKMKFWVKKCDVKLIVIDYLQIIEIMDEVAKYMTEVQALNYVIKAIRRTAKQLKTPVLLLSQLNRELYKHGSKEPNISHLKGSGFIEEAAGLIAFLHRPEYYGDETDEDGESTKGLMYQIIAKHRFGRTGRVKHKYVPKFSMIAEWREETPLQDFNPMNTTFYSHDDEEDPF